MSIFTDATLLFHYRFIIEPLRKLFDEPLDARKSDRPRRAVKAFLTERQLIEHCCRTADPTIRMALPEDYLDFHLKEFLLGKVGSFRGLQQH